MPALSFYFKGGGASVQFYGAAADQVTFARLTRKSGQYRMHILTGGFVDFGSSCLSSNPSSRLDANTT